MLPQMLWVVKLFWDDQQNPATFIRELGVKHVYDFLQVLDEEAEVFVVKMWRLLVYETEAKKLGLVKWWLLHR